MVTAAVLPLGKHLVCVGGPVLFLSLRVPSCVLLASARLLVMHSWQGHACAQAFDGLGCLWTGQGYALACSLAWLCLPFCTLPLIHTSNHITIVLTHRYQ
jgi:hypothetical protein